MVLFFHIFVAIAGLITSSIAVIKPTNKLISVCYVFSASIVASGVVLTISTGNILRSCVFGLLVLVLQASGIAIARHKLNLAKQSI
jgi:hypothetical protein